MAPKKAAATPAKAKVEIPSCGLTVESCTLPVWDDAENDKEQWGDLTAAHVDPASQYVDADTPSPPVAAFVGVAGLDWRRPGGVFSPFKPVVVRPVVSGNPYEYVPPTGAGTEATATDDDDDSPQPQSRSEMVALYRALKPLRSGGADDEAAPGRRGQAASTTSKRRDRAVAPTPFFMRAFNSALMVLNQSQALVPAGSYAWELIHPQGPGHLPTYNPAGKYAVKLYFAGQFRRVLIDDRLPTDGFGQCILTVTESKEIWPALLAKAMLKVLGPKHEGLLFTNPGFTVQTLLCGWAPQYMNPKQDEALTYRVIREGVTQMRAHQEQLAQMDASVVAAAAAAGGGAAAPTSPPSVPSTPSGGARPKGAVLVATCNDTSTTAATSSVVEQHATAAGLHCGQAFAVMDMRPFQNTSLVRLCSPGAAWKGNYGYDSATWTGEVEESIGFVPARDRSQADLQRRWNDFWIPWDSFVKFFSSVATFKDAMAKDCAVFKQITHATDPPMPPADAAPPAKGKAAAAAAPPPADNKPRVVTRWVCFNFDAPTNVHLAISGTPVRPDPAPKSGTATPEASVSAAPVDPNADLVTAVAVSSYDWQRADPFTPVLALKTLNGLTNSKVLRVGAGQRAFRIVVRDIYNGMSVSVMAPSEFSMGDQKDICRDVLSVHTISDAGVYHEHTPKVPTIWFKRFVSVKNPCSAQLAISTLPKGSDLAQYKQVPVEAPTGKGGKADKGKPAAKGKAAAAEPAAAENINDLIDDREHARPITDFVRLHVIDLDNGAATGDTVGKIMDFAFQPNKNGYIVIARATTPEDFGKGYWRLVCTSDKPLDAFEPRPFEEVQTHAGRYQQNDLDSLFRYTITAAEHATTTVQVALSDSGTQVPVTLSLFHNDTLVEKRESVGGATIEHATLVPSEKTAPSTYAIQCTVDKDFIRRWAEVRRVQVVQTYRAEAEAQAARLKQRQQELARLLAQDPTATIPSEAEADENGEVSVDSIGFTVSLHSSSAKIEVKEDASVNEATNAVKQSWSRKDDAPAAPAKGGKGAGKGQTVDESAARFAKAKESRDKFLANRHGVFLPFVSSTTNKPVLTPADDPNGHRFAAPAPPLPYEAASRLHGGFTRDGENLHGGIDGAVAMEAASSAPPVYAKPDIKAELERVQTELVPALREERKAAVAAAQATASAFFAELRPERPPTEPAEEEKKKPAGKGKK